MLLEKHNFDLFADYFQFYLQDEQADLDLSSNVWSEQAIEDLLAAASGIIYVRTARNMIVPAAVEIHDTEPKESFNLWEHITECSIEVSSGILVVLGCTDYFPEAARIKVVPGKYRARIFYSGLDNLSENGLDGNDYYKVVLWPGETTAPQVIKRHIKEKTINAG